MVCVDSKANSKIVIYVQSVLPVLAPNVCLIVKTRQGYLKIVPSPSCCYGPPLHVYAIHHVYQVNMGILLPDCGVSKCSLNSILGLQKHGHMIIGPLRDRP